MDGTQPFRKRCRVLGALSALAIWAAGCQPSSPPLTFPPTEIPALEGPDGREEKLLSTDAQGRFYEEIAPKATGPYRLTYRALCDSNQPGASATPIAVHVRE